MLRNRWATLAVAITVGGGLLAAGCGSNDDSSSSTAAGSSGSSTTSSSSGKPLKILFVGDSSGPTKATAREQLVGLQAGAKYWNAHGGFGGRQAEVVTQNSNGDAATAVSTTIKYLTSNPKPDYTWAGNEGNQIAAMIPVMKQRGLLAGAVNDGNTQCQTKAAADCPTFFSLGASPATAAEAYANWAKTNGYKNVGILEEGIAFTQSETPAVSAALDKLGIKHEKVSFPGTAINVTSQVSQLKGKGVDAVFAEALGPAAGYTLAARTKLGWKVPLLFDVAGSSLDLTKLSKPGDLDGVQVTLGTPTDGAIDSPGVTAMVENAKTYGGLGGQPLYIAAFGWDAMVTLHNAIAQAKSTDPKAVAAAMESLSPAAQSDPMLTLSKKISYSADNHENNSYAPSDYKIVDAGPLKGGQIG